MMKLETLPAAKGDCLILHHGSESDPRLILIDGGPGGVYNQSLKPRLEALRAERVGSGQIASDDPLLIDLLVISHIDDDHINGILALLGDIDNGAPFRIGRLWHNSFDSLVDAGQGQVASLIAPGTKITASLSGAPIARKSAGQRDIAEVIASIPQGHALLGLARKLNIPVNPEFGGKAIEAISNGQPMVVDDLSVTILGPLKGELDALRRDFADWLARQAAGTGTPASLLASFTDRSVANLSSIVLLLEGGTRKYLLTGDARADKMIKAAKSFGLLDSNGQLPVDLFKVPHHGSDRNNSIRSFEAFPAPHYVFSGNGEHGNPERQTFEDLAAARPGVPLTIELTYSPADIDNERAAEWSKKRARKPSLPPFDQQSQGIVPFLTSQTHFTIQHP